jgi:hypothetical protein
LQVGAFGRESRPSSLSSLSRALPALRTSTCAGSGADGSCPGPGARSSRRDKCRGGSRGGKSGPWCDPDRLPRRGARNGTVGNAPPDTPHADARRDRRGHCDPLPALSQHPRRSSLHWTRPARRKKPARRTSGRGGNRLRQKQSLPEGRPLHESTLMPGRRRLREKTMRKKSCGRWMRNCRNRCCDCGLGWLHERKPHCGNPSEPAQAQHEPPPIAFSAWTPASPSCATSSLPPGSCPWQTQEGMSRSEGEEGKI